MKLAHGAFICALLTTSVVSYGQNSVGIGVANPNRNAVLELVSPNNNQGLLIPKMTTAQRTAGTFTSGLTTKETGLLVFDSEQAKFYYWAGTSWTEFGGGSGLTGGSGITITNNVVSTIPQDLQLTGNILKITNNAGATSIDLSSLGGGSPTGAAGGDLTGSYPNPTVGLNAITSTKILDGTVATADIAADAITTAKILDGTIGTGDIAADAITTAKILDGTVSNGDLGANAVTSAKILDGTIVNADVADDAVTTNKILDGTVGTNDIANNAITTGKILDATIATADLADNSITSIKVVDGTIVAADIATDAVTTAKILDATIATADLADNSVTSIKVLDGTIAAADIATDAVTTAKILDGTIAAADIATDAVTTAKILDGTVASADIAADAITTAKILDGTIVNADISATAAIDVAKFVAGAPGQVLTTSGAVVGWANPSGTTLINNVGTRNLFAGASVGSPGGTSTDNTYYGFLAGAPNTTGSFNAIFGSAAGSNNVQGSLNTIMGWRAGFATNPTATFNGNTLLGAQAGQNVTGGPNTYVGEKSGWNTTSGTLNVFMGNSSGSVVTTGNQNVIIGYFADASAGLTNLQNSIAIGYNTKVDANNKIRLGNNLVSVIEGQVAFTAASDRRLKTNIAPLTSGLDFITSLKPVSYIMKDLDDKRTQWGFIAQDIEQLVGTNNAILTIRNDQDRTLGLRYTDFIAPLVKAVQEQQDEITDLKKKNEELALEIEQIRKAIGLKADNRK